MFFKIIDAKRQARGQPIISNEASKRRTLFAQTMQEYEKHKSRGENSHDSKNRNLNHLHPSRPIIQEDFKQSRDYEVKVKPPARRSSTLKKPKKKNVLQQNSEAVIDTRRNNAWQSEHFRLQAREEDKVQDIQESRDENPNEESKILNIVNRELDFMRKEQLNDSQEGADIGVRLLDTPNVNQRERNRNTSYDQESQILNLGNERQRLI